MKYADFRPSDFDGCLREVVYFSGRFLCEFSVKLIQSHVNGADTV